MFSESMLIYMQKPKLMNGTKQTINTLAILENESHQALDQYMTAYHVDIRRIRTNVK